MSWNTIYLQLEIHFKIHLQEKKYTIFSFYLVLSGRKTVNCFVQAPLTFTYQMSSV
jgi:hypothetical protein